MEQQRSYGRIEGAGGAGAEAVSSSWGDPDPGDLTGYQLLGRRVKGDGSWELNVSPSFLEDPSRLLSSQVHLREGVGNTAGEVDVRKRLGNARPANHPYHLADHLNASSGSVSLQTGGRFEQLLATKLDLQNQFDSRPDSTSSSPSLSLLYPPSHFEPNPASSSTASSSTSSPYLSNQSHDQSQSRAQMLGHNMSMLSSYPPNHQISTVFSPFQIEALLGDMNQTHIPPDLVAPPPPPPLPYGPWSSYGHNPAPDPCLPSLLFNPSNLDPTPNPLPAHWDSAAHYPLNSDLNRFRSNGPSPNISFSNEIPLFPLQSSPHPSDATYQTRSESCAHSAVGNPPPRSTCFGSTRPSLSSPAVPGPSSGRSDFPRQNQLSDIPAERQGDVPYPSRPNLHEPPVCHGQNHGNVHHYRHPRAGHYGPDVLVPANVQVSNLEALASTSEQMKRRVTHQLEDIDVDDEKHHSEPDPDQEREERKVVNIACNRCRARKLKCDGTRPQCHNCARRNEGVCEYDPVLRRRGPGRKPKKTRSTLKRISIPEFGADGQLGSIEMSMGEE